MFVNSVIRWNKENYRIIRLHNNQVYLISLDKKTNKYMVTPKEVVDSAVSKGEISQIEDPFKAKSVLRPDSRTKALAEENYALIHDLVSDPDVLFNKAARCALIREKTNGSRSVEQKIRRLLTLWWQRGQTFAALVPDYGKNFGHQLTGKLVGRKSCTGIERKAVDQGNRRLFDQIIRKYVFAGKASISLKRAYACYLSLFLDKNPELTGNDAASFWQFRYFYKTSYTPLEKAQGKSDPISYKKDIRALHGTVYDIVNSVGSVYEIDSTTADVYLVSSEDRTKIVGRPVLYVVTDVYTGMIAGVDVKLDNAQYRSAADALFIAFTSKKELCARHGITISEEAWPIQGIPAKIVADNAELLGDQIEQLGISYGVELSVTPSRRPDLKSTVERTIGLIQQELRPFLTGVPDPIKLKKAGGKDTRTDASFTLEEYYQAVLNAVLVVNHHLRSCIPLGFPASLPASPMNLWDWAKQNGNSDLRDIRNPLELRLALMKHMSCSFSRDGAEVEGIRYLCQDGLDSGWFERNTHAFRPKGVSIVVDPGNVSIAYMFPDREHKPETYWKCTLAPGSAHLAGKTMIEAQDYLKEARKAREIGKINENTRRAGFCRLMKELQQSTVESKPKDTRSHSQKVSGIPENRHNERVLQEKTNPCLSETPLRPDQSEPNSYKSARREFVPSGEGYPDDFDQIHD